LGYCFESLEKNKQAAAYYQQGLEIAQTLDQNKDVQRETSNLYINLGNVLTNMGHYEDAQTAYKQSLAIATSQQRAIIKGQLGTLALAQGKLAEAEKYYKKALDMSQNFPEPSTKAIYLHQLGNVYDEAKQWEAAEHAYRKAAKIFEDQGNLATAAQTWSNLGLVTKNMGKWTEAEAWYRKGIEGFKNSGQTDIAHKTILNIADLLKNQPDRLPEAQQLAEQALAVKETLDPATTEIWLTYELLAQIADKQDNAQEAKKNRRLAREAKANFAGTRYELKQKYSQLILGTVAAIENAEVRKALETALEGFAGQWENLKTAIQQILAGERDKEKLCDPLSFGEAPIITAILDGIEQPESLEWFEE
jgi:tetratricopeptide (TPR) repeat protein